MCALIESTNERYWPGWLISYSSEVSGHRYNQQLVQSISYMHVIAIAEQIAVFLKNAHKRSTILPRQHSPSFYMNFDTARFLCSCVG
jgi:hypothetical protein